MPTGGTEYRAPSARGEVWALPLGAVPAMIGDQLKVVWRVTGRGPLRVVARDPSGRRHALAFGPEPHLTSSFRHPGREWGTGFTLDAPGCWTVTVRRQGAVATVGIPVA
jgi:hypothetical protein